MAKTLEEYLNSIKDTHDLSKRQASTFEWYLQKIRELAEKTYGKGVGSSVHKVPTSEEILREDKQQTRERDSADSTAAREDVKKNRIFSTTSSFDRFDLGRMLFFQYDPKHKDTLPYYDRFPLIFPFKMNADSMLAMNLHYLPRYERAKLMEALLTTADTKKLDPRTRLRITYELLNKRSKFAFFKPCIKRYLWDHVRSRVMVISADEWINVAFMPLADFMKADEYKVWQDSIEIIKKAKYS